MKKFGILSAILSSLLMVIVGCSNGDDGIVPSPHISAASFDNLQGLNPKVLALGLDAYRYALASGTVSKKNLLTVVDYNQPSWQKRLYIINLSEHKVIFKGLVAQGNKTGIFKATHFSNSIHSHESSLGTFVTGKTYDGKHGNSMRIHGLEKGINNNAYARAVVMHPANYVSEAIAQSENRIGTTWGCLGINPRYSNKVINYIKGGSVIFSYANPEKHDSNILKYHT